MSTFWVWLLAGGLVVSAVAVVLGNRFALRIVRPVRRPPGRTPADAGAACEDVTIPGPYPLRGWLLRPREDGGGPVVALGHGWGANSGVLVDLAAALAERGYPVLLYDYRGHGRSGDAPFVTIRHYRDDTREAARWMVARFPERPVVLGGHSMGGAASILATVEDALAAGIVLVAAPADVLDATARYLGERGLPGRALVLVLKPFWDRLIGEPYRRLIPAGRAVELSVPVLVIHPELDERVTLDEAHRLAEAAGSEVEVLEGADHRDVLHDSRTAHLILEFLEGLGGRAPSPSTPGG